MINSMGPWVSWDEPEPTPPRTLPNLAAMPCPACGAPLIGQLVIHEIFVCIACRALVTLDIDYDIIGSPHGRAVLINDAYLRLPTLDEEDQALRSPKVIEAIRMVAEHHRVHGSPHPRISPPDTGPTMDTETGGTQVIRDHQGRVIQRGGTHFDDIGPVPPFPPRDEDDPPPPY